MGYEVNARTGSDGQTWSWLHPDNLKSGGLGAYINKSVVDLSEIKWSSAKMWKLAGIDRYSLLASFLMREEGISESESVEYANHKGAVYIKFGESTFKESKKKISEV